MGRTTYRLIVIATLCRSHSSWASAKKERLIDQLEMQLEDAEADATEHELAAERPDQVPLE